MCCMVGSELSILSQFNVFRTSERIFSDNISMGMPFALTSYTGFEATAVFRQEASNPEATILGRLVVGCDRDVLIWLCVRLSE